MHTSFGIGVEPLLHSGALLVPVVGWDCTVVQGLGLLPYWFLVLD